MRILDPHCHLIDLTLGEYAWLRDDVICRSVDEASLSLPAPLDLHGIVHIEAGFDNTRPWREVDWLNDTVSMPMRAVAGVDLLSETFDATLEALLQRENLVGVRDILDERANSVLGQPLVQARLAKLADYSLSFDAQLSVADQNSFTALFDTARAHPTLVFILNHAGWPPNDREAYKQWAKNMKSLASLDNVAVKLSGWEMTDRQWTFASAIDTTEDVVSAFGNKRVMLASNFPLCTWRMPYGNYWQHWVNELSARFDESNIARLTCTNAEAWYRFTTQ